MKTQFHQENGGFIYEYEQNQSKKHLQTEGIFSGGFICCKNLYYTRNERQQYFQCFFGKVRA